MKKLLFLLTLGLSGLSLSAQHVGIVRKNYFSTYFDTLLNMNIQVLDSSTIRLGSINPQTGAVSNLGAEYAMGINLTGATIDPYAGQYYIGSGTNLLTFDLNTGTLLNNVPVGGPLGTPAFQNYRFNPSDTVVYGLVPQNFYSTVFDSMTMTTIQVLDSSALRFARMNPSTGQYSLLGNTNFGKVYTLAGNSIDPHQMLYYYSAVDTFVAIDLYTGNLYSEVAIQLPAGALFENFTYSCADTAIYGLVRQNYFSQVYDSLLQQFVDVIDSTTIKLARINPNTGAVTVLSPQNLAMGATLNGSCFIDPNTMTYYFSTGTDLVGVSLSTGQITGVVPKTFSAGAMYFDMMRSSSNCLGALKVRQNNPTGLAPLQAGTEAGLSLYPNPATDEVQLRSGMPVLGYAISDLSGKRLLSGSGNRADIRSLAAGVYLLKATGADGAAAVVKFVKQ